jgi:hypothetical protein
MPTGVSNADLLDLTRTTLENLPDQEFEVALDFQRYHVCNQWFRGDRTEVDSGTSIKRNIILDTSGNAKFVRLYQKTAIGVTDVQQHITAPWVQAQTHWSIERREALRNRAPARFVRLIQSRRVDATVDLADLLERRAWSAPQSATDDLNPRGVPYWISFRDDGSSGEGFDGDTIRYAGGTSSSTDKGGINPSDAANAKWKNWAATYTSVNADFVQKMRKAFHATHFESPLLAKDLEAGPASMYRLYMNLDTLTMYEDLATKQNDNLGRDVDPFHGITVFKKVPIHFTPQLDGFSVTGGSGGANTPDPVYGINHAKFIPFVLEGDWMRESDPMMDVELHNVITTFVDSSFQFMCLNVREGGFALHKLISA